MAQLKDLIVNGPSRFIGDVYATTFTGDLNGNANTATSATTASALTGKTLVTASAVTTSNWPTYADNHIPTMSFMAYWNGAYSGTSSNLTYCAQGAIIGSNNIGNQSVKYATTSGTCSGNAATAGSATSADCADAIASKGMLDSQEKIDNFITPNRFEYASFKTTDANNVDFASNDGMIISIPWASDSYGFQMAFDDTRNGTIKVRGKSNSWGDWYTLLHSGNYNSYSPKLDGTGASGTWGISISGNATTATKIGSSTVGSTTMPVYIKSGAPTAITSFPEAYLSWGGTSTSGSVTPIGMTLSSEHSANRLAFINGNALTFEYSSDAGSTWTDYGYTASIKSQVFTTSYVIPIGRANSSTEYTTNSRTRITLTAQDGTNGYVYTNPRKMLINISSSGGMQVLIEYRTGTNYKNNGAWTTFGTYTLSGLSGWNDIPLILGTLGGGSTQTANNWQLRLTFIMTSKYADYPTSASVNCIRIFGENAWGSPSTMAATGHLYSFDISQNATFPAAITSTMFKKSGGTSSQFLKADGSVDSNTYSKSDHKHSFSDITPGVAIIGDGVNRLMFRTDPNWKSGMYYSTAGNEALVFGTANPMTSWIFATTDPTTQTAWTSLTPSLQIKHGRVTINKLIANSADASYYLDVNGSANATTLYENGVRVSIDGHTHTKSQITDFPSSLPASDVYSWAKADTKPSYTGTEVTLSGYSKNSSYKPIEPGDSVQAAIAKLEGAISGLENLLASI